MNFFCKFLLAVALLMAGHANADDLTVRAMKLYEMHHYEAAEKLLRPQLAAMDSAHKAAASLALGMSYLGSAMLYRNLHQAALAVEIDYLGQLRKQRSGTPSRYVDLYLGQALLEADKPAEAVVYLKKFAAQKSVPSDARSFAIVGLGVAYNKLKQMQKSNSAWSSVDKRKPEIKAALAGAYAMTGTQGYNLVLLADTALNDAKLQGHVPSASMLSNILRAYSFAGSTDKALDLLDSRDLAEASYIEELGASKSISFYDAGLLADLYRIHLRAAVSYLDQASRDEKTGKIATYYLAEAYLLMGNAEMSLRNAANFLAQSGLPLQYRNKAMVNQAGAYSISGRHTEARTAWLAMAEKSTEDPALLAVVMVSCVQSGLDCLKLEKHALDAIEKGEGKKFFPLNTALGRYYLRQKQYAKALLYLEAGRDKANKNKIEANDPVMLVDLAQAYYLNRKYSENLEIYFELGKQFPVVRQLQEAMQGIYAMEQHSAGDVKIF
jgi:hypothetical protein